MASETTYTRLRANSAAVLDKVVDDRGKVVVRRKDGRDGVFTPVCAECAALVDRPA